MFIIVGEKHCPGCGAEGKVMDHIRDVPLYICPVCGNIFSEFGLVGKYSDKKFT